MNTKKVKILKMSKFLSTFLKIGAFASIMAIAGATVAIIMAPSLDSTSLSISGIWGNMPLKLDNDVNEFRAIMISEMLNAGVMAAILFVASFIFKDMSRESKPFTQKNSNRLKVISLLTIVFSIVIQPLRALLVLIFIPSADIHFFINIGYFIFAAIFFCLALIFEYGAELQREYDETL